MREYKSNKFKNIVFVLLSVLMLFSIKSTISVKAEVKPSITDIGSSENIVKEEKSLIDKPMTKEELIDNMKIVLKDRPKQANLNYYGGDINTFPDIYDLVISASQSGNYYTSNVDEFIYYEPTRNKDGSVTIKVDLVYRTSGEEEAFIEKEVKRVIEEIIEPDMNSVETIKAIHDYVLNNNFYTEEVADPYSAFAFFSEGAGVCNAFTLSISRLLDEVGIDNYCVSGYAGMGEDLELHAWNKVKIASNWYNVDVTWNEPEDEAGKQGAYYYFLVSDERFNRDHTPDSPQYLPLATDTTYDGFYDNYENNQNK